MLSFLGIADQTLGFLGFFASLLSGAAPSAWSDAIMPISLARHSKRRRTFANSETQPFYPSEMSSFKVLSRSFAQANGNVRRPYRACCIFQMTAELTNPVSTKILGDSDEDFVHTRIRFLSTKRLTHRKQLL